MMSVDPAPLRTTTILVVALLGGCVASPAVAPSAGALQHVEPAKSGALIYTGSNVYDLATGKQVGQLSGFDVHFTSEGLCTDKAGDVFVSGMLVRSAAVYGSAAYEFTHGSFTPIGMVSESYAAIGCAVDPATGNLAISNLNSKGNVFRGSVAIFSKAQGNPTYYNAPAGKRFAFCTYDGAGNLYVTEDDGGLVRMAKGKTSFESIKVSNGAFVHSLQWYAGRLDLSGFVPHREGTPVYIYRAAVSGNTATVEATTTLTNKGDFPSFEQFWVDGGRVVGSGHDGKKLLEWNYPGGGLPTTVLSTDQYFGVAVSP